MDDKEYYSMMNRMPSDALLSELKKKAQRANLMKKKSAGKIMTSASFENQANTSFMATESRQGREDAEMLIIEKKDEDDGD